MSVFKGVVPGVERAGHSWADEGVETGETSVEARRHIHAQALREPHYGTTVWPHRATDCDKSNC